MIQYNQFRLIVNVKNLSEALKAQEENADAILLYDEIPDTIIELEVSGPQFRTDIVKDIINNVSIPLFVRVRIGNLVEINMLKKLGVKHFYEVNIVKKCDQLIKYSSVNDNQYISMCAISNFKDIVERINDGYKMFKVSGKTLLDSVLKCKDIHSSIQEILELTKTQLQNYSKNKDIPLKLLEYITTYQNIPGYIYISKINNSQDLDILKQEKTIGYLLSGIIVENGIYNNVENDLLYLDKYRIN